MNILAIESSCDETAASVVSFDDAKITVLSNVISSQIELHRKWGGVVPNLAAREHVKNITAVLTQALLDANKKTVDIDLLAVTAGPGLIPALLIGTNAAQSLAYAWKKPLLGMHHITGHIYASWINAPQPQFPVLALVVSGGHTQLMLMKDHFNFEIIGQTHDDAVGEAFDKVARILGLPYPGGPEIAVRADAFDGNTAHYDIALPHPMKDGDHLDFSFSGLKTSVLYNVRDFRKKNKLSEEDELPTDFVNEFAWAFQKKAVEVLLHKTKIAIESHSPKSVILAGGVSANIHLRTSLQELVSHYTNTTAHTPDLAYCLDNAAMIATAAAYKWQTFSDAERTEAQNGWRTVCAHARMDINML